MLFSDLSTWTVDLLIGTDTRHLLASLAFFVSVATNAAEHGLLLYARGNENAHPVFDDLGLHMIDTLQEWAYTALLFLCGVPFVAAVGCALAVRPVFQGIINYAIHGRLIDENEPDRFPIRFRGRVIARWPKLFAGRRRLYQGMTGFLLISLHLLLTDAMILGQLAAVFAIGLMEYLLVYKRFGEEPSFDAYRDDALIPSFTTGALFAGGLVAFFPAERADVDLVVLAAGVGVSAFVIAVAGQVLHSYNIDPGTIGKFVAALIGLCTSAMFVSQALAA